MITIPVLSGVDRIEGDLIMPNNTEALALWRGVLLQNGWTVTPGCTQGDQGTSRVRVGEDETREENDEERLSSGSCRSHCRRGAARTGGPLFKLTLTNMEGDEESLTDVS